MENADWPTQGLGRMREKSVVITGAAKGIGRATAELFAREGARLVVTDVEEVGLGGLSERLAPSGAEVETVVDDVSVAEEAKKMIAAAVKRFGRIDVLIANADVIDSAKEEQGRLLRRLYEWAVSLDHEGLVRLGTYHAKGGDMMSLLPRLRADNAGLVTIYNYAGVASLQFWRSVFERRAPESLPRVEQAAPVPVGQGNTTPEVSDELLEALTGAYREAASGRIG